MVGYIDMFRKKAKKIKLEVLNAVMWVKKAQYSKSASLSKEQSREIIEAFSCPPTGNSIRSNTIHRPYVYDLQIIVPAYNVERYLKECMDSILSQKTKYQFLVVLVDDGSKDGTGIIADSYTNDKRVRVIHQQNKGLSGARNTALQNIYAEYVMFVDSDDFIAEGAIDSLIDAAKQYQADIVQGKHYAMYDTDSVPDKQSGGTPEQVIPALGNLQGFAWGKVFRSELFEDTIFPEGYWYEDTMLSYLIYQRVQKAMLLPQIVYYYRKTNENSITATAPKKPKCIDSFFITEMLMKEHAERGLPVDQAYIEKTFRQIVLNARRIEQTPQEVKEAIFVLSCEMVEQYLPENFTSKTYSGLIFAMQNHDYGMYEAYIKMFQ